MSDDRITVRPSPIHDVLVNPGMGFETFHCFVGDERHNSATNYPDCSIAYYRFYWDVLEPQEGRYNFDLIDDLLVQAKASKQDLALRMMPMASPGTETKSPQWFVDRAKGTVVTRARNAGTCWVPDHNDDYFLDKQHRLVAAFGERYNGHGDIIRMDIGSVGFWGEWHISSTTPPVEMITEDNALKVIDWYLKYWDKTPLSALIGYVPGLRYASENGCGWRADSLGDYGHFHPPWSHMYDAYPNKLFEAGAYDAWHRGPVTFEPPGDNLDMERYVPSRAGGYDSMWDQALAWHATSHNPKSRDIPDSQVGPNQRFLKRCGYRFVIDRFAYPRSVRLNQTVSLELDVTNAGVAPPYKDYVVAVRLLGGNHCSILDTGILTTKWLPGSHSLAVSPALPAETAAGEYDLSFGVLDPDTAEAEVKLAVEGRGPDGWYPMGKVIVS